MVVTRDPGPSLATQWAGLLLAPATFFAHLQGAYVLVPRACRYHQDLWLHVVGVASVILGLVGVLLAWQVWRSTSYATDGGGAVGRARFLGATGLGVSSLLTLLLLAQWLAAFVISPCQ